MSERLRLAATLLALLLPTAFMGNWLLASASHSPDIPPPVLPDRLGPWERGDDTELEAEVLAIIEPDAYVVRSYERDGRAPIWIYVGVYAGRAGYGKGAHDPEVCYPAQGWEILRSDSISLRLSDGGELPARQLAVHQVDQQEAVLYWFQPAGRWPRRGATEQIFRVFDAVMDRNQYAFVRLSAPAGGEYTDSEADLVEFAAEIAPAIRREVEQLR